MQTERMPITSQGEEGQTHGTPPISPTNGSMGREGSPRKSRIAHRVQLMPSSGIRRFFDIASTMPNVISLGVGEPDFITPEPIRQAGKRSIDITTSYTSNSGLIELRRAIAEELAQRYGVYYNPETEILLTVGVSEGMQTAALTLFNAGDEVLIPEPSFVAYPAAVLMADGRPVFVPTYVEEQFEVARAALEAAITPKTRGIIIGYPNNPTGGIMRRERLLEIAEIAERYDLVVFSDEIYARLVYGVEHICFAALPGMRERTVLMGGFSKSYAMTGWRLGWLAAPSEILQSMTRVHQYAIMSAPTMSQYAALEAMRVGEPYVQAMCAEYNRRRQVIVRGLNDIGLPTFEPRGAFYAFPYVAHLGISSQEFAERLLQEEQVAVIPGDNFGPSGVGYVRACYANSMENIERALERIERFVRRISGS